MAGAVRIGVFPVAAGTLVAEEGAVCGCSTIAVDSADALGGAAALAADVEPCAESTLDVDRPNNRNRPPPATNTNDAPAKTNANVRFSPLGLSTRETFVATDTVLVEEAIARPAANS